MYRHNNVTTRGRVDVKTQKVAPRNPQPLRPALGIAARFRAPTAADGPVPVGGFFVPSISSFSATALFRNCSRMVAMVDRFYLAGGGAPQH